MVADGEINALLAQGHSMVDVAGKLGISAATVGRAQVV
jgi:DNA-binding CsgD family transcriptional regulator